MQKTIMGLGVVLVSASLLTACNTVKDTATGIEHTAAGVGQTVTGAFVGAGQDVKATEKAVTTHHKAAKKAHHKAHKKAHHKAHKKAHHKAHKKMHHKAMKKMDEKSAAPAEMQAPAAQ